jgi:hypothetical protein
MKKAVFQATSPRQGVWADPQPHCERALKRRSGSSWLPGCFRCGSKSVASRDIGARHPCAINVTRRPNFDLSAYSLDLRGVIGAASRKPCGNDTIYTRTARRFALSRHTPQPSPIESRTANENDGLAYRPPLCAIHYVRLVFADQSAKSASAKPKELTLYRVIGSSVAVL